MSAAMLLSVIRLCVGDAPASVEDGKVAALRGLLDGAGAVAHGGGLTVGEMRLRLLLGVVHQDTARALSEAKAFVASGAATSDDVDRAEDLEAMIQVVTQAGIDAPGFAAALSTARRDFALQRAPADHSFDEEEQEEAERLKRRGAAVAMLRIRPHEEQKLYENVTQIALGVEAIDKQIGDEVRKGFTDRADHPFTHALNLGRRVVLSIDDEIARRFPDRENVNRILEGVDPSGFAAMRRIRDARAGILAWSHGGEQAVKTIEGLRERLVEIEAAQEAERRRAEQEMADLRREMEFSRVDRAAQKFLGVVEGMRLVGDRDSLCQAVYESRERMFGVVFLDGAGEVWESRLGDGGKLLLVCPRLCATYDLIAMRDAALGRAPFEGKGGWVRFCVVSPAPQTRFAAAENFVVVFEHVTGLEPGTKSLFHAFINTRSAFDAQG
jgi:hypothetical protein